ncbi:uncharacterized protein [Diadema antillarum]|uniref:uncharacterized protein n=1 Tax=Diadema antillarum TaxID=105358 RepID=UPI003A88E1D0
MESSNKGIPPSCVATLTANTGSDPGGGTPPEARSRTIMWCVPRTISSAVTKCFSAIDGIEVWFEPYFYCLGTETVIARDRNLTIRRNTKETKTSISKQRTIYRQSGDGMPSSLDTCRKYASIQRLLERSTGKHVFVKDMATAMKSCNFEFLPKGYKHTFLIRHPLRVFTSLRKATYSRFSELGTICGESSDEKTVDVGRDYIFMDPSQLAFGELYELWKYVRENLDSDPIVIDADDLLSNPAELLPKYCEAIGLPYDESLLKWDASMSLTGKWNVAGEDLIQSIKCFYDRALTTGTFGSPGPMPSRDHVTPDVIRCTDAVMKYYDELYESRLTV